ncbi:transmembrane protein 205-like [Ruditapes philippinarum]|uniref:transmembrane protein 205-like n=1 Tax=Ruditapes philippinarum TaxID=129788 RepID=UPI00295AA7AD|nr:transmembrane protein 205-like [Ruditapes philippinarum]
MGHKIAAHLEQSVCVTKSSCSKFGRYCSLLSIVVLIAAIVTGATKSSANKSSHIAFLHLLSFAAHFGAQCWVTFVAGFAMFFSLPRIMFGHLQSRMFPLYFTTTLILSCITLLTFVVRHPFSTLSSSESKQLLGLCICVVSTFVNSFYIAPRIVEAMISVFEIEKSSGVAYVVGYCDKTELKKDPKYAKHYRTFRLFHSVSGVANVITLICNIVYLHYLASLFVKLDSTCCL